jgi:putative RNA 2'-phosphotransferase
MKNDLTRKDKYMSLLLRHQPEKENLTMDKFGWVPVKQLLSRLDLTMEELEEIVETNNKQRFSFSEDKKSIRANQGHSIPVDVQLKEIKPPTILYHGTATRFLTSIYDKGIIKGQRNHVHLSALEETAISVGKRHGSVYVLHIDAEQMYADGYKFYLSENGVWLTDFVPRKYIKN